MDAKVAELIRNHSAPNSAAVSGIAYASLYGSKSRFAVAPQKMAEFLDGYCALAVEDETAEEEADNFQTLGLSLGEVAMTKTLPLMVPMLFKFHLAPENRDDPSLYGEDFIKAIVHAIQILMGEKLDLSSKMSEFMCVVLESRPWHTGETTFVEMRFQFPYAQVDSGYQQKIFRPELIKKFRQMKIASRLEVEAVGDWDTIVQDIKDVVPLYRSKDDAVKCPLGLTHIFAYIQEDQIDSHDVQELDLKPIFVPSHHSFIYTNVVTNAFLAKEVDVRHWLPLFLSINFWSGVTHPKTVDGNAPSGGAMEYEVKENENDKTPIYLARCLLPMLSVDRFNTEPYWLDVGRVLYKITDGSEEGLSLWTQYSAKATVPGRDKAACANKYYTLRGSPLDHHTIGWFAREDSPGQYQEWHQAWCQNPLSEALSCTHLEVSEAIWRWFWLDFICVGFDKRCWYRFDKTYLKRMDDAVYLRTAISEELIPAYKRMRVELSNQTLSLNGKDTDKKHLETVIKQIGDLIKKLSNQGYRTSIINMCREKFYVENFDKLCDADPNKTGHANCVIECCADRAYARPGKPQDYITMNTSVYYQSHFTWQHPLVMELMTWFQQCFPDKELLHYFLKDSAAMLLGRNAEKLFRVWSGEGDNSKSMIVKLFQAVLGMYCIDFPVEMLMKTFGRSSGPTPELAQARGAHMGVVAEPDADEDIQAGKLKRFSGGDRMFARMCNSDGGSMEAFFKFVLMCNRPPNIPGVDKAVRNRFQILPFLSTWLKSGYPEDPAEQMKQRKFKMDPFFENRIPELAQAMLWVMVEYFPKYKAEGLKAPVIVTEHTQRHWSENDPYINFRDECLSYAYKGEAKEQKIDDSQSMTATDLYRHFKIWYKDMYPGATPIQQKDFAREMKQSHRLGPTNSKKRWVGIKVNEAQQQHTAGRPELPNNR